MSDAKCFSGSRYSFRVQELKPLLFHNWPVHGEIAWFSSNAAVAFLGTTVTSNDDTLALQSSAAGSAQNVGIQILDRTGEVLILDGATFSAKTDLIDGTNILPFQARYIALGQSVAGTANADATFKVQYL
ncbi:fimbrial protein [Escherichia coli]|nr:fimbrial protein [Escherichia coli]TGF64324.1 fimbrial protein [Escherichia coli]